MIDREVTAWSPRGRDAVYLNQRFRSDRGGIRLVTTRFAAGS
jgi:hypothetical protein